MSTHFDDNTNKMKGFLILIPILLVCQTFECKSVSTGDISQDLDKLIEDGQKTINRTFNQTSQSGPGVEPDKLLRLINDDSEDDESCGLRKVANISQIISPQTVKLKGAKGMGRIVGGVDAQPFEFPWQVSIQIFIPKKKRIEHFCGGAVINHQWILTASHCLDILRGKEKNLIVKIGSNKMKDPNTPDYNVEKFILHEGWNRKTQSNDIALLKVREKIEYKINDNNQYVVNRVCLPEKDTEFTAGTATLSGFGQTGATAGQSEYLQKLDVPIYDHAKCVVNYKKYVKINEKKLCAGGKGGQDSCMGDSGGPLIHNNGTKNEIIGIVSFGYPCAVKDMPGVYTHVSKYVDWINEQIEE